MNWFLGIIAVFALIVLIPLVFSKLIDSIKTAISNDIYDAKAKRESDENYEKFLIRSERIKKSDMTKHIIEHLKSVEHLAWIIDIYCNKVVIKNRLNNDAYFEYVNSNYLPQPYEYTISFYQNGYHNLQYFDKHGYKHYTNDADVLAKCIMNALKHKYEKKAEYDYSYDVSTYEYLRLYRTDKIKEKSSLKRW